MLREMGPHSRVSTGIARLADKPAPAVADTPVLSPSSMNLQWGAFLASGDEKFVTNILVAVGHGEPGLDAAARYSLAMNAVAHPRVMAICQAELAKEPSDTASVVRAALNDAAKSSSRPRS